MTYEEISCFLAVVKQGSITAAAGKLFLSQPALSRKLRSLEDELGYALIIRGRGIKNIALTGEGSAFVPVAEKWLALWDETRKIKTFSEKNAFKIAAIGSVLTYLMPQAIKEFVKRFPKCRLTITTQHSYACYELIAGGGADIAFSSNHFYMKGVETIPVESEEMVLTSMREYGSEISCGDLNPDLEIRCPWSPEFDIWHDRRFGANAVPGVVVDQMGIFESIMDEDSWAITPLSVAEHLRRVKGCRITKLTDGPQNRNIYCLLGDNRKEEYIGAILETMKRSALNSRDAS